MENNSISNVFIISRNNFPNGDAGALRDYSFAKIYRALGYKVIIICNNPTQKSGIFDNFTFYSIHSEKINNDLFSKFHYEFGFKNKVINLFNKYNYQFKDSIVHFPDLPLNMITYLKKISKLSNLKLLHDSVEWYSKQNFKYGIFSFGFIHKTLMNRFFITKEIKVISISTYLHNYFLNKGVLSIRIPVILADNYSKVKPVKIYNPNKIKILYAGSPARKDSLTNIIKAVIIFNKKYNNILKLNIVGVSKFDSKYSSFESKNIVFHGKKKRAFILNQYKLTDYSILIRPEELIYTKAGFPTKVVESMSNFVPVISNITSDLGLYLKHNFNSVISNSSHIDEILIALKFVANINENSYNKIRIKAHEDYKKIFYYENHINSFKKFLFLKNNV